MMVTTFFSFIETRFLLNFLQNCWNYLVGTQMLICRITILFPKPLHASMVVEWLIDFYRYKVRNSANSSQYFPNSIPVWLVLIAIILVFYFFIFSRNDLALLQLLNTSTRYTHYNALLIRKSSQPWQQKRH